VVGPVDLGVAAVLDRRMSTSHLLMVWGGLAALCLAGIVAALLALVRTPRIPAK
jgi:hypothetical protein